MIDNALAIGEIKFTLAPKSFTIGNWEKKLPIIRYKGVPGGCGIPIMIEVAINSPQSQSDTVGAIVLK